MDKLRWLLVGAGDIAKKRVAPALVAASRSELVAVCDVRADQAQALAAEFKAPATYAGLDQALADAAAFDAVYLATPVGLHIRQAVAALRAGKHVLVEKPLGLSAADCAEAVDAARKTGKKAACAYFRRLSPRYRQAREMLDRGEFGKVVSVRMTYFSWFNPAPDDPKVWRVVRAKSGGGALSDMGTHMFDVLIGLFGMPESVIARCENLTTAWDVEDSAALILKLKDGALATASFNWNSKTWRHEFEIVGTEARLDWLPYDTGPVTKVVGRNTESLDLPGAANVHLPLVQDFTDAVLDNREPAVPLAEAAKTNRLLDAVYRSSAESREILL